MNGRVWLAHISLIVLVGAGWSQNTAEMPHGAHPWFEVATIRLSNPASQQQAIDTSGGKVLLIGQTLSSMVTFAYHVHREQIVGQPNWTSTERYDVVGIPNVGGEPDLDQIQEMVQKLLADRFGMRFHGERRDRPYYAIVVAKGGPKVTRSVTVIDDMPHQSMSGNGKEKEIKFRNDTMSDLALALQLVTDRPLIDETALVGRFDFKLRWQLDDAQLTDPDAPPTFFTALQEQLGLKLEKKRGPVDVLVLDKISKPTAN